MEQISFFNVPAPAVGGEHWKILGDYPDYWISDRGRVWNCLTGRTVRAFLDRDGRGAVTLFKNGAKRTFLVAKLVAANFVANPKGYGYVRHKSPDLTDDRARNLEWVAYPMDKPKKAREEGKKERRIQKRTRLRQYS